MQGSSNFIEPLELAPNLDVAWLAGAASTREPNRLTGVAVATLGSWRARGGGLPFGKLGRRNVPYHWMAGHKRRNTADQGHRLG